MVAGCASPESWALGTDDLELVDFCVCVCVLRPPIFVDRQSVVVGGEKSV